MPHYADGTEAKIGDIVRGKWYNQKDKAGNLREIVGTVMGIVPDSKSCNIRVAHIKTTEVPTLSFEQSQFYNGKGVTCSMDGKTAVAAYVDMEYGECGHFVKIG